MANGPRDDVPGARAVDDIATGAAPTGEAATQFERPLPREDITLPPLDDRRRQEAQEVLAAASGILGRSLDLRETAEAIARAAIPRFADCAVVEALDENGRLARLALAHSDPPLLTAAHAVDGWWPQDREGRSATRAVFDTGQPMILSDVRDEDFVPLARGDEHFGTWCALRARSCLAVPLEAAGERLGVLTLFTREGGRRYTADDLPLALELARRAAITLVNALLFGRERRARAEAVAARDRTERLQRLGAELTRSLRPDAVAEVVVRHVVLALGADSACVLELSEDEPEFRLLGAAGVDASTRERVARVPVDTPLPIGELARTGEAVLIGDSAVWRAAHPELPVMSEEGVRAWAALPLRVPEGSSSRLLGALTVSLPGPHLFAEEERGFLQAFADLCAQALERARLFEGEATARVLAERLQALSGALAGVRTPDDIARAAGREAREAVGASVAGVGLLSDDGSTFTMKILEGVNDAVREAWRTFPNTQAIPYGVVVAERAPLFFASRAAYSARFPHLAPELEAGCFEAAAVVPLVTGDGRALGAAHFDFAAPRAFSAAERQAFLSIAQECAAALERVRMYEAERAHAVAVAARLEAEAASRAKDELLAFVSHELRAPLAPARALAQVLAITEALAPEYRETAAEIERHIAVEARLIDNLLEYERAGRGLLTVRCGRCDLREVGRRALRAANAMLRDKEIDVEEAYLDDDAVAWADPLRVQQIIDNLLTNAAKFSPYGTAVVMRTYNPAPGWVAIEVADAGYGIAPVDLPRLFKPFTQLGGPQGSHSGLGLGLALSRSFAELQRGTLTAASEGRGLGATFTLRLPTARAHAAQAMESAVTGAEAAASEEDASEEAVPEKVGAHVTAGDGGGALRILLIEDDGDTAVALRRLLSVHGHVVHLAPSVAMAEEIVCTETLDVLLSDLRLAGESGLDAPRRLADAARRCGRSAPPAVVLSGFAGENDVAQTRAAGFVAHLIKPVNGQSLLQALRRAAAMGDAARRR